MTALFRIQSVSVAVGLLLVAVALWVGASAQPLDLRGTSDDEPITIEAEDGIEWKQEFSVVTARGNARATKGNVEVKADALSAFYREREEGKTEIWRLEAVGNVRIASPTETAFGDKGTYDVDKAIFVLTGENGVRVDSDQGTITADGQLEFWENDLIVVARGNARARQGERGVDADVLVAYLRTDDAGATQLHRIEAYDDVHVYTPEENARADRGSYDVASGLASLAGSVRIQKGTNQLAGCRAEVNLKSGVSKLFGCAQAAGGLQVEGLITPESGNQTSILDGRN